jgi:predicted dehydrogenase
MQVIRFGIIGCGLMGREFASAVARWCHLPQMDIRPSLVAICNRTLSREKTGWFTDSFATIKQVTADYREIIANPDVDAVYCAVPHHFHQELYCAIVEAGKHLLGEKPFGIDKAANDTIMACIGRHPNVFVRCSSEFAFFPGPQRIGKMLDDDAFGDILEANSGFLHSSDLNPDKPINWKRMVEYNGEYGCMGDLGMHVCHIPFRAGWRPTDVRAILSNIIPQRKDASGTTVPCDTWDNATLFCSTSGSRNNRQFPWTIKTHRISPGQKNTWYLEILGTKACARWTTKNANTLEVIEYSGGEQLWRLLDLGHETAFKSITGGIFEFGFSDSMLQMIAAFLYESQHGKPLTRFAGCVTPEETALSHRLFTAALASHENRSTVCI